MDVWNLVIVLSLSLSLSLLLGLGLGLCRLPLFGRGWGASHSWILTLGLLTDLLPRRASRYRLYDLWWDDQFLLNQEHAGIVLDGTAVVGAWADRDELVVGEFVDSINWVLMGTHDHADLVLLVKLVHDVWPVTHDVILLLWVSCRVLLQPDHFIGGRRITP